ncbi:MAG: phosphate propanoyltransferase [Eubacteriales bacterium]
MPKIMIETSARHIHLKREDVDTLFGKGYQLTPKKELSQPGQYAAAEKLTVVGPRGQLNATILGPERNITQVELSLTDARTIGVGLPIRESGDIAGSGKCKLIGPAGELELTEGVIAAKRHVHLDPATAAAYGLHDKQVVQVRTNGERPLVFDEVVVRVRADFLPTMHIDTDEANAAYGVTEGEIIAH